MKTYREYVRCQPCSFRVLVWIERHRARITRLWRRILNRDEEEG